MSTLYMYTFMPIVFIVVVTVMWLLHKVKKTKYIKKVPTSEHEKMKYEKREITAVMGLIVAWIMVGLPHVLDVPYLVTGNLKEAMGTVIGGDVVTEEKDEAVCKFLFEKATNAIYS